MSLDCKEFCERICKAYKEFMSDTLRDGEAQKNLSAEVEKIVKEFTADTMLEIERKAKKKSDAMYEAVKLIEDALEEIDHISPDEKPRVAICQLQNARSDLIISM